jgi:uncharacterized membrane protein
MKKVFIFLILLIFPLGVLAQEASQEENFKAKVVEILDQKEVTDESGLVIIQQNLKLKALSGSLSGEEIIFQGIGNLQFLSSRAYDVGDKLIMSHEIDGENKNDFFILDYDRTSAILWLSIVFVLSVLAIGRWKGLRSLLALGISFFVIIKFIIPQILLGHNPVLIGMVGGIIILFFSIYLTQGFNKKAHLANLALIISLSLVAILSVLFTKVAYLSGYAGEETIFLLDLTQGSINLQGLLLAGIMIGTLGVLDDIIVSQVSTVEQIKQANSSLSNLQVYKMSLKVGIDHITSMINTLFFAYAGAALPLLIVFTQSDVVGLNLGQMINNEMISTEVIRTLLGSVGIILAIPIASWLASYFLKSKQ